MPKLARAAVLAVLAPAALILTGLGIRLLLAAPTVPDDTTPAPAPPSASPLLLPTPRVGT